MGRACVAEWLAGWVAESRGCQWVALGGWMAGCGGVVWIRIRLAEGSGSVRVGLG